MSRKYFWPLVLLLQVIVLQILSFFPNVVENVYSTGIFPVISSVMRTALGWVPFSVGDVLYGVVLVWLVIGILRNRKSFTWKGSVLAVVSGVSIFFLVFNLSWGLNYYRVRLSDKLGIDTEYTDSALLAFTQKLIERTNRLQLQIAKDSAQKIVVPHSQYEIMKLNVSGYKKLASRFPDFTYGRPSNKNSLISLPLTYMGFAGYMNPFTHESQVNALLPMYAYPMTSAHEMAHQVGYASESEANFIGFMAALENDDPYIRYSALTAALRYCLSNWEARNPEMLEKLLANINPGIRVNFRESRDFWSRYESFIETGFHLFYDNFLKINSQDEGLESYSRFVDLMVNYDQKYGLFSVDQP